MESLAVLVPAGCLVVPSYLYLRRFFGGHPGVREWVEAWAVLYLTGLYEALFLGAPVWAAGAEVLSNLFVALLASGALRFMERPVPPGLFPGLIAAGFVTAAWQVVDPIVGDAAGSAVRSVAIAWVAVQLLRHARDTESGRAVGLLAAAVAGVALVQAFDTDLWLTDATRPQVYAAWLGFGGTSAAMQLMAMVDRFQTRSSEMQEERELSRCIPDTVGRDGDLPRALSRLARELRTRSLPRAAVFALTEDGMTLERVPWSEGSPDPKAPRPCVPVDTEPVRRVVGAQGPVPLSVSLGSLPASSGVAAPADPEEERAVACALRAERRIVGVLCVETRGAAETDRLARRLRRLVPVIDLALSRTTIEAERRLRASELDLTQRLFEATLGALPVGIIFVDPDDVIASANDAWARLLGLEGPEAWVGRPAAEALELLRAGALPEDRARIDEQFRPWLENPSLEGEPVELTLDQWNRSLRITAKGAPGAPGQPAGRLFVIEDVTADRQMGERLQHAQRMETVGTVAGGLAHDFNNLLTAILGNAQLLLQDTPDSDEHREALEDMARSAEHCSELTRGLLTFAQQGPVARRRVEVGSLLEGVERLLRPSLAPDTQLRMDVAPGTPAILADPGELRRVLTNLLVNARDAVGSRGEIECRVAPSDEAGFVEILVHDDGIGMGEATRRRAFDPFFTTKAKGRGTGLGLAVAYGIAEAHGATIEVESRLGRGSTFRVRWPAAPQPAEEKRLHRADRDGVTVLVAEDEVGVRRMVRRVLQRAGYRVLEASDGERAVDAFARHRDEIGLVICDLNMPGRDGLSAVADMRVLRPGVPALLMSGDPDREFGLARPEDVGVLPKPFGPEQLVRSVAEALGEGSPGLARS